VARKQSSSWVPSFLRHRNLIGAEAVLLVGAGNQWLSEWVGGQPIHNTWKVLFTMASTLGLFGGLMLFTGLTRSAVSGTHQAVRVLPAPLLLIHLVAFAGIFLLYAHLLHLPLLPPSHP
jgi:hypothetical protein